MTVHNSIITQIRIPDNWNVFYRKGSPLLDKLSLITDWDKPSFFFSTRTIDEVLDKHRSLAVIIVNNTTNTLKPRLNEIKKRSNIHFISTSKLTNHRLDELGLKYVEFPASLIQPIPNPIKKGKGIYFYSALGEQRFYGYLRIKEILETHFPHIPLIGAQGKKGDSKRLFPSYSREQLYTDIYPQCFLAIRLTKHDGLSGTVQELGLRGIKTIWNGGTPSALSYQSDEDIIEHIRREEMLIDTTDTQLAEQVAQFIDPTNAQYNHIFETETYLNPKAIIPQVFR